MLTQAKREASAEAEITPPSPNYLSVVHGIEKVIWNKEHHRVADGFSISEYTSGTRGTTYNVFNANGIPALHDGKERDERGDEPAAAEHRCHSHRGHLMSVDQRLAADGIIPAHTHTRPRFHPHADNNLHFPDGDPDLSKAMQQRCRMEAVVSCTSREVRTRQKISP